MQNKFAAIAMIMMVMIGMTGFAAATYDSSVTLENKGSAWDVIEDDISAVVEYSSVGAEFAWRVTGTTALPNTDYSLIYYADKPDRFVNWGGNNPGALIGTFTTGNNCDIPTTAYGYTELGMHLPHTNDANIDEYDYCDLDDYDTCHGAKLWIVLSDDYNPPELVAWHPAEYLFETDLITYEDCGEYPASPPTATFSIGDAFNVDTVPIMILGATNAGSVDMTLTYDPAVVSITGITNGEMEAMFYNQGAGQVRIGAYQTNNPGIDGDFVLVSVAFARIGEGSCEFDIFDITVTTYKDATPCGNTMPSDVSTGVYCACLNGDVNCDGDVDMFDAMYIAKYSIEISGFDNICECAADVDGDSEGVIDIADASYLARHILGMTGYETLN